MDLIFLGLRLRDFYECFITETRNKTNENGKRKFLWNLFLRLIIGNVLRIFTFIFFLFIYVVFFCVLATNAQKLIKHQLILQEIIPLS